MARLLPFVKAREKSCGSKVRCEVKLRARRTEPKLTGARARIAAGCSSLAVEHRPTDFGNVSSMWHQSSSACQTGWQREIKALDRSLFLAAERVRSRHAHQAMVWQVLESFTVCSGRQLPRRKAGSRNDIHALRRKPELKCAPTIRMMSHGARCLRTVRDWQKDAHPVQSSLRRPPRLTLHRVSVGRQLVYYYRRTVKPCFTLSFLVYARVQMPRRVVMGCVSLCWP